MSDSPRTPREDDLPELVAELSATLERLQAQLDENRHEKRRATDSRVADPPATRELLRFTESYTIPTVIALLESGIRSLELLRATLRVADGRPVGSSADRERPSTTAGRVDDLRRVTLDRFDDVLKDLQSALEGGEPSDDPSRELLEEASRLRAEIDARLEETSERDRRRRDGGESGHRIPVVSSGEPERADHDTAEEAADEAVDVEAELETIRRDVAEERGDSLSEDTTEGADEAEDDGAADEE